MPQCWLKHMRLHEDLLHHQSAAAGCQYAATNPLHAKQRGGLRRDGGVSGCGSAFFVHRGRLHKSSIWEDCGPLSHRTHPTGTTCSTARRLFHILPTAQTQKASPGLTVAPDLWPPPWEGKSQFSSWLDAFGLHVVRRLGGQISTNTIQWMDGWIRLIIWPSRRKRGFVVLHSAFCVGVKIIFIDITYIQRNFQWRLYPTSGA